MSVISSTSSTPFDSFPPTPTPAHAAARSPTFPLPKSAMDALHRLTVTAAPSSGSVGAVASSLGITPPVKLTSKFIIDEKTGEIWRVYIQVEGGKLKQTEASFTNISTEFNDQNVFATLDPASKNKITIEHASNKCSVNGNPTAITFSNNFVTNYHYGITSSDPDQDIVLEKQAVVTTPENGASKTLREAEEFAAKPYDPAQNKAQINKLEAANLDDLTDAQKVTHTEVLAALKAREPIPAPKTAFDLSAEEYEDMDAPISTETHLATLARINELNGQKVKILMPADGKPWTLEPGPNSISRTAILPLDKKGNLQFIALPILHEDRHILLVIDKDKNVSYYDPSRDMTEPVKQTVNNLLVGKNLKPVLFKQFQVCKDDVNSSVYCANFFESLCKKTKKIAFNDTPTFALQEKRTALGKLNREYLADITAQTKQIVAARPDLGQCVQSQLRSIPPTPNFEDQVAHPLCILEHKNSAVEVAEELHALRSGMQIVLGQRGSRLESELSARTPINAAPNCWHRAEGLPLLRDGKDTNFAFRNSADTKIDALLSASLDLKETDWLDDTLLPTTETLFKNHVYRQVTSALKGKSAPYDLVIEPPKFYANLPAARQLEIKRLYESVLANQEFDGKIDKIYFAESKIESDFEEFKKSIIDFELDNPDLNEGLVELFDADSRAYAKYLKIAEPIEILDKLAELRAACVEV